MGSSVGLLSSQEEGLIPRVLRDVFCVLEKQDRQAQEQRGDFSKSSHVTNLRLSFVEIYNEEIRCVGRPVKLCIFFLTVTAYVILPTVFNTVHRHVNRRDLLHPEVSSRDIGLREDAQGRIFFVGAREEAVSSLEQALAFLDKGIWSGVEWEVGRVHALL